MYYQFSKVLNDMERFDFGRAYKSYKFKKIITL